MSAERSYGLSDLYEAGGRVLWRLHGMLGLVEAALVRYAQGATCAGCYGRGVLRKQGVPCSQCGGRGWVVPR